VTNTINIRRNWMEGYVGRYHWTNDVRPTIWYLGRETDELRSGTGILLGMDSWAYPPNLGGGKVANMET
jgi:hypothetical protein